MALLIIAEFEYNPILLSITMYNYDMWKTSTAEDYYNYDGDCAAEREMEKSRNQILDHLLTFFKDPNFPVDMLAKVLLGAKWECVDDADKIAEIFGINNLDKSQLYAIDSDLKNFSKEWEYNFSPDFDF